MKLEIIDKTENKLMHRVEIKFKAVHVGESTPNRDAIKDALASNFSAPKDNIIVTRMNSEYGKCSTDGYAKIYDSADIAKTHERNYLLVRNGLAEKKVRASKKKKK